MIDLNGPVRREYTIEEQVLLKKKFFITLHSFLLLYLSLHNFILPLISNILREEPLYKNLHFWFFVHIPVNYLVRKKGIPSTLFGFLVAGSVARVICEVFLASSHLLSWSVFSTILTETATFIFYFFYARDYEWEKKKFVSGAIGGILLATVLSVFEYRLLEKSELVQSKKSLKTETYGCEDSLNQIHFPLEKKVSQQKLQILSCGFAQDEVRVSQQFLLSNASGLNLNLRIYRLKWSDGKISWKFLRIIPLDELESVDLSSYLEEQMPLVVKIPERKKLGHVILVPQNSDTHFPPGILTTTYDSIRWDHHE